MLPTGQFAALDREALLHALISGGGALLLGYALYLRTTDGSATQVRGLTRCGAGFLVSAGASMYLRDHLVLGAVVSLAGTVLAMSGMLTLLRDRVERGQRGVERRRRP